MYKLITAATAALLPFVSFSAQAFEKPPFPRLGGYKISTPQDYENPDYLADLTKLDVLVLQNFPGWERAHHTTMDTVVANIKRVNPNAVVATYVNVNELVTTPGATWGEVTAKLNAQKWWLYPSGQNGKPVVSTWGAGFGITNYTMGAKADANGQRYVDWYPQWAYKTYFQNNPKVDGVFTDNFFWRPRVNGDWNRDGKSESFSGTEAQKLHREGMVKYVQNWRKLMPGKYMLGNIDWADVSATAPEYDQLLNGGLLERHIGYSWSPEGQDLNGVKNSFGSWKLMMDQYHKVMARVAEPKLIIFMQYGKTTDYQAFRYGLTSCLMDDGYYDFAPGKYYESPKFDEYDAKLGQAIAKPPTAAWKQGVWRREFENGIALVNPRGNGAQTIDLGGTFKHFSGKQDATVNNGQQTTKVTLKDRDGIILMRLAPISKPQAPKMISTSVE
jgi:hypothetical protein